MSMSKKDFIALADELRPLITGGPQEVAFLAALVRFCASRNPAFNASRWLGYLEGTCGPSGGARTRPQAGDVLGP